ncbi:MAG: imidazoleglycerol-phosphate dehydratase [Candidatus Omnitrophica bacterium]|jgi:imidazoleglycerol-phosphate dehydratase|nr:imidazoleglycerol-phosphate dehydratase [Candidatus Omnitrophota bacterium]
MKKRNASVKRSSRETQIDIKLVLDGDGNSKIDTGIGLLDHMLELFAFHGFFDLTIKAKGDLKVDIHHTNEDIGIVLGDAFKKALGDKKALRRFGSSSVPMEDVVSQVVVDISGRGFFNGIEGKITQDAKLKNTQGYSFEYANHFFEAFAKRLGVNLSIKLSSDNVDLHTNLEPVFKAFGIALDMATQIEPRRKGVPSTKGIID